tara:strand:+ start:491 stop:1234 length:744 start_codon:yes stop_codon:yes gene_type:complete
MKLFARDPFNHFLFVKKWLIRIFGLLSYRRFHGINNLNIEGSEIIRDLPEKNVLFISNHQTYFADVTAMLHVFNASLNGRVDNIKGVSYLFNLKLNIFFIAAKETMKSGIIPKILESTGSVSISRTWRSKGEKINRPLDMNDVDNIKKSLRSGWLITFPQGTTRAWAPIRKGTAHIIKENEPIVVPIVIDGFRRSFDRTGLFIKKKGVNQSIKIKKPLEIDYKNDSIDLIVDKISHSIEQHPSFLKI